MGRAIRKLRNNKKWKQATLANEAGMTITTISHIETGKTNPTIYDIERIAKALGTTVSGLLVVSRKSFHKKDQYLIDHVGNVVRQRRLEIGLSRKELADKAGFLPQYVATTENFKSLPRLPNLYSLADALEISILRFWPETDDALDFKPIALNELGQRISATRKAVGLSLSELAAILSISPTAMLAIESGKSLPKLSTLIAIGVAFQIRPSRLLKSP